MANLSVSTLGNTYATFHAVHGIALEISEEAFAVLIEPSGCGTFPCRA